MKQWRNKPMDVSGERVPGRGTARAKTFRKASAWHIRHLVSRLVWPQWSKKEGELTELVLERQGSFADFGGPCRSSKYKTLTTSKMGRSKGLWGERGLVSTHYVTSTFVGTGDWDQIRQSLWSHKDSILLEKTGNIQVKNKWTRQFQIVRNINNKK